MGLRSVRITAPAAPTTPGMAVADRVVVYYLHATFRCVTCNTIEKMARALLDARFADALADGRIEWREADFQQQDELAKRYEVVSSCVVVVRIRDGRESGFRRLDEVWTLMSDPPAFDKYVGDAVREALPAAPVEGKRP